MRSVVFKCPNSDVESRASIPRQEDVPDGRRFFAVECTGCQQTHLIDITTAKLSGAFRPNVNESIQNSRRRE